MIKVAIIAVTDQGIERAIVLQKQFPKSMVITTRVNDFGIPTVSSITAYLADNFAMLDGICFVSALGICVRSIAPYLVDKQTDPAVICVDDMGIHVQAVLSGHCGGGNDFALKVARILGAKAVVSTASDVQSIWPLDTLGEKFGWKTKASVPMNKIMAAFVNNRPTALLLDVRSEGTDSLEKEKPSFVEVFYQREKINETQFDLVISVSYKIFDFSKPHLAFIPQVLCVGSGCSRSLDPLLFEDTLRKQFFDKGLAFEAIKSIGSISIKANQSAYKALSVSNSIPFETFTASQIDTVTVPNPSKVVESKLGVVSVSESCALLLSENQNLLLEKQKIHLDNGQKFTYAVALVRPAERKPRIAIIGAGPGDETLITVKGKQYLEEADCVLYAGSLIPEEMTNWCKPGAIVQDSAVMTLEEQMDLMHEQYQKGTFIVRLQSGDPSLYGAIQEQMTLFDELGMDYFIVPGISSFSAGAAALKSEFTIPEVVQSIVLTRGEGKTPMPPEENLINFAKTKATLCIFLSAGIAQKVQNQLLAHFEKDTPVAVLYRLTWKDEAIYRGKLEDLARIVRDSKKKRTVLIIVGQAIGARKNRSQLYSSNWRHLFRTRKITG